MQDICRKNVQSCEYCKNQDITPHPLNEKFVNALKDCDPPKEVKAETAAPSSSQRQQPELIARASRQSSRFELEGGKTISPIRCKLTRSKQLAKIKEKFERIASLPLEQKAICLEDQPTREGVLSFKH